MRFRRIVRWLALVGTSAAGARDGDRWVNAPCPLAAARHRTGRDANPSFGVRSDGRPGVAAVKCFACGFHGTQVTLLFEARRLGVPGIEYGRAMRMLEREDELGGFGVEGPSFEEAYGAAPRPLSAYAESWREAMEPAYAGDRVHPYLEARGVGPRVARFVDARWDALEQRIVFPVRDWDGVLRGLHGRAVRARAKPPYKMYRATGGTNPVVWFGEHWVDPTRPVVVVESVFDAASVLRVERNVIAPLTASLSPAKVRRVDRCVDLVHLFDGDDAGRRGSALLASCLPDSRHRVVELGDGEDPGGLDESRIRRLLCQVNLGGRSWH